MPMPYITYSASEHTYHIRPGAAVADIMAAARNAPAGSTLLFEAGTHRLTDTLIIDRGDITLRGASEKTTTIVVAHSDAEGIRFDGDDPVWQRKMTSDVTQGSKSFTLPAGVTVKAGDVLGLHMANDASLYKYGPYAEVKTSPYWSQKPLRESLVEVDHVVGNTVYLKHEIAFDMTAGKTVLAKYDLLENVKISDLTVTYTLGTPKDSRLFSNPATDYKQATAILVSGTHGLEVENVTVRNAASSGLIIRRALEPHVDNYTADGAHNKGSDKNGYGLSIEEVFYGNFEHLNLVNTRHAFLFSGWNAEAYNTVHITSMNRDVNYHGGPDRANTVLIDYANYLDGHEVNGDRKSWGLVDDGGDPNPPTDISQNVNLFKIAFGSFRDETLTGWDGGAFLDGRDGNDTLTGGKGRDVLIGGNNDDIVSGKGGRDWFVVRPGDDGLTVTDFQAGSNGDQIVLNGFAARSFAALPWRQSGHDLTMTLEGATVVLKNVGLGAFLASNVAFNLTPSPAAETPAAPVPTPSSMTGTSGNDTLTGTHDADLIHGQAGNDTINGRNGNDRLYGDAGDDSLDGGWNDDRLDGGAGRDALHGNYGNDLLYGGDGDDRLYGDNDNDLLTGQAGNDILNGGRGDDRLDGGAGQDLLYGGPGADTFILGTLENGIHDILSDFNPAEDHIDLSALLNRGGSAYTATVGGVTGVYYDADGAGAAKPVLVAVFGDDALPPAHLRDVLA